MNNIAFPLTRENDSSCVQGCFPWSEDEKACTRYLRAWSCPGFLGTSGYFSFFTSSCFVKVCEQLITGLELACDHEFHSQNALFS